MSVRCWLPDFSMSLWKKSCFKAVSWEFYHYSTWDVQAGTLKYIIYLLNSEKFALWQVICIVFDWVRKCETRSLSGSEVICQPLYCISVGLCAGRRPFSFPKIFCYSLGALTYLMWIQMGQVLYEIRYIVSLSGMFTRRQSFTPIFTFLLYY